MMSRSFFFRLSKTFNRNFAHFPVVNIHLLKSVVTQPEEFHERKAVNMKRGREVGTEAWKDNRPIELVLLVRSFSGTFHT